MYKFIFHIFMINLNLLYVYIDKISNSFLDVGLLRKLPEKQS